MLFRSNEIDDPRAEPDSAPRLELGRAVYQAHCASCHWEKLQGQPDWRRRLPNGVAQLLLLIMEISKHLNISPLNKQRVAHLHLILARLPLLVGISQLITVWVQGLRQGLIFHKELLLLLNMV